MMKLLFLILSLSAPQLAAACPLGAGETELSLTRVMRNFGRGIFPADRATKKGEQDPAGVTAEELTAALGGLEIALSCAHLAADDRSGRLFPRRASELNGQERDHYLNLFFTRMKEFHEGLAGYRAELMVISAKPGVERDFGKAKVKMLEVGRLADRAHRDLE